VRYQLKQIYCRPGTLSGLSLKLIESHYENNYGGALRRLNALTEQLESLDFATTPGFVINGLKREELVALNSTVLHELYFASMGGEGKVTKAMSEALVRDFGSVERWRTEFSAMGYALGGGSGWVLLSWMPRDGRLINQYAGEHSQAIASGIPVLALDMYEHATTSTSAPTRGRTSIRFCAMSIGRRSKAGMRTPARWLLRGRWCRRSSATFPAWVLRRCGPC